jgi:hypothetical protein
MSAQFAAAMTEEVPKPDDIVAKLWLLALWLSASHSPHYRVLRPFE